MSQYIEDYKKKYRSKQKLDRPFTYETKEKLKTYYPWRANKFISVFDSINDDTLLITYTKDKWYYCIESMWWTKETNKKLRELEEYSMDNCVQCWCKWKQISYHLPIKFRDHCRCEEASIADERDWHTSQDVLDRLLLV